MSTWTRHDLDHILVLSYRRRKNPIVERPASAITIESIVHERVAAPTLVEPLPELLVTHPPEEPHCFPAAHHSPSVQHVAPAGIQLAPQVVVVPVHPLKDEVGAGLVPVASVVGCGLSVTTGSGVSVGSGTESAVVLGSGTSVGTGTSVGIGTSMV